MDVESTFFIFYIFSFLALSLLFILFHFYYFSLFRFLLFLIIAIEDCTLDEWLFGFLTPGEHVQAACLRAPERLITRLLVSPSCARRRATSRTSTSDIQNGRSPTIEAWDLRPCDSHRTMHIHTRCIIRISCCSEERLMYRCLCTGDR